jgi:hypothetical protein
MNQRCHQLSSRQSHQRHKGGGKGEEALCLPQADLIIQICRTAIGKSRLSHEKKDNGSHTNQNTFWLQICNSNNRVSP